MATHLETDRLALREMTPDDIDFVAAMLGDAQVMRWYPRVYSRAESREWLERQRWRYSTYGCGLWLCEERHTGVPVGQAGLLMQDVDGAIEPEIGYLLHRPFWRLGYATEATRAVKRYAFETRDHPHVIALVRPGNEASAAVAKRLGMTPRREIDIFGAKHIVFQADRAS